MAEHANTFLLLTILVLVTILLVFGMKYFSAARTVHARANGEEAYRELAEKAVALQAANAYAASPCDPAMFTIENGWPRACESAGRKARTAESVGPPGGNGISRRTGLLG